MAMGTVLAQAAELDGVNADLPIAWLVTALALVLTAIGHRRMPIGVGQGLFVGALSALLLLNYASLSATAGRPTPLSESLGALAIIWFIVAVWIERRAGSATHDDRPDNRAVRVELSVHAAAIAGLLTVPALLTEQRPEGPLATAFLLILLLAIAIGFYVWRHGALARYAIVAVLLASLVLPTRLPVPRSWVLALGLFLGAVATLTVVLATMWSDWRRRTRIWRANPDELVEPLPRHRRVYGLVVVACAVVGSGSIVVCEHPLIPLAVALAALAASAVGHRWRSNAVGELSLALAGESVIVAALAWLPASPANALLGWTLAGVWMLWLARFWHQQLDGGKPWTTAGRLIPAARNLGYAAVGGQLVLAATWALRPPETTPADWQMALAALFMLLQWSMLVRAAAIQKSSTAALAACIVLLAALVPVQRIAAGFGLAAPAAVLLAAGSLALALRCGSPHRDHGVAWAYNAYVGGVIPLAAVYALALRGEWLDHRIALASAAVCCLLALVLRWGTHKRAREAA